ncbi:hypothetical protein MY11210_004185 [Beauveria gryllotalpidicola]
MCRASSTLYPTKARFVPANAARSSTPPTTSPQLLEIPPLIFYFVQQPYRNPAPHKPANHDDGNPLHRLPRRHRPQRKFPSLPPPLFNSSLNLDKNNPLHMSTFPSHDAATNTLAPVRTPLEFSLLLSSAVDVFELQARRRRAASLATGDVGLLHAVDDRLAAYGFETNTGARLVCVVDMRGRRVGGTVVSSSSSSSATGGGPGLRDADLRPVFRAMQDAYVRLLQNPFYEPERHVPSGGRGGAKITSKAFGEAMRRIGESWTPGVTSL